MTLEVHKGQFRDSVTKRSVGASQVLAHIEELKQRRLLICPYCAHGFEPQGKRSYGACPGCERAMAAEEKLARAVYLAEHLWQMIPREVWRDHGGDDGQGHYEGDYHAEKVRDELAAMKGETT